MHKPERARRTPETPGGGVQTTRPLLNEAAPEKEAKLESPSMKRERNENRRTKDACRPTFIACVGLRYSCEWTFVPVKLTNATNAIPQPAQKGHGCLR